MYTFNSASFAFSSSNRPLPTCTQKDHVYTQDLTCIYHCTYLHLSNTYSIHHIYRLRAWACSQKRTYAHMLPHTQTHTQNIRTHIHTSTPMQIHPNLTNLTKIHNYTHTRTRAHTHTHTSTHTYLSRLCKLH